MRPKYIESPEELWALFEEFLLWQEMNPYEKKEWVGKDGDEVTREIQRFPTWAGFEGWLARQGKIQKLDDYESNKGNRYKEYAAIVTCIKKICNGECLTAAVSGVAKENLVARITGLADKTAVEHSGEVKTITGMRITDSGDNTGLQGK